MEGHGAFEDYEPEDDALISYASCLADGGASITSPARCTKPAAKMGMLTGGRPAPSPVYKVLLPKCGGLFTATVVFVFTHVVVNRQEDR